VPVVLDFSLFSQGLGPRFGPGFRVFIAERTSGCKPVRAFGSKRAAFSAVKVALSGRKSFNRPLKMGAPEPHFLPRNEQFQSVAADFPSDPPGAKTASHFFRRALSLGVGRGFGDLETLSHISQKVNTVSHFSDFSVP
jgi:hypothetical protein